MSLSSKEGKERLSGDLTHNSAFSLLHKNLEKESDTSSTGCTKVPLFTNNKYIKCAVTLHNVLLF